MKLLIKYLYHNAKMMRFALIKQLHNTRVTSLYIFTLESFSTFQNT